MKTTVLLLFIAFTLFSILSATSVSFHIENSVAELSNTWMFDRSLSPNLYPPSTEWFIPHPVSPVWDYVHTFYRSFYARESYAYMYNATLFHAPVTDSWVTGVSGFPYINGAMPDTTIYLYFGDRYTNGEFRMLSFQHQNVVDQDTNWNIMGQAGDYRVYGPGTFEVTKNMGTPSSYNPLVKLRITDVYYYLSAPYPSPFGTNQPITAHGWGMIDFANSDPNWAHYFDAKNGQVEFDFTSFSQVVQTGAFGVFNSDLTMTNATVLRYPASAYSPFYPSQLNSISQNHLQLDISEGAHYWDNAAYGPGHDLFTNQTIEAPTGDLPAGIERFYPEAQWEAGTNSDTFTAALTFDLSNIHGVQNPANIRILQRTNGLGSTWQVLPTILVSTNPIRVQATNLHTLGFFAIGSTGGNNLSLDTPAPLNINVVYGAQNTVELTWQGVSHAVNYNVYTSSTPDAPVATWTRVAHLDAATLYYSEPVNIEKKFYHVTAEKY